MVHSSRLDKKSMAMIPVFYNCEGGISPFGIYKTVKGNQPTRNSRASTVGEDVSSLTTISMNLQERRNQKHLQAYVCQLLQRAR